jgi:hypothetical protein
VASRRGDEQIIGAEIAHRNPEYKKFRKSHSLGSRKNWDRREVRSPSQYSLAQAQETGASPVQPATMPGVRRREDVMENER